MASKSAIPDCSLLRRIFRLLFTMFFGVSVIRIQTAALPF